MYPTTTFHHRLSIPLKKWPGTYVRSSLHVESCSTVTVRQRLARVPVELRCPVREVGDKRCWVLPLKRRVRDTHVLDNSWRFWGIYSDEARCEWYSWVNHKGKPYTHVSSYNAGGRHIIDDEYDIDPYPLLSYDRLAEERRKMSDEENEEV